MNIAPYIDHTILKQDIRTHEVEGLCEEALTHGFAAVCVPPHMVRDAAGLCAESEVKVATVVGFPFGYSCAAAKEAEIVQAISDGADELDMVINISDVKNNNWSLLSKELSYCLQPVRLHNKTLKLIIESGLLTDEEIIQCCELISRHQVDFAKTSTGYGGSGASIHAVQLMRKHLPPFVKIKASGGIRDLAAAQEFVRAGAERIGTSSGLHIVQEYSESL